MKCARHSLPPIVWILLFASVVLGRTSDSKLPKVIIESALNHPEHQTTVQQLSKRAVSLKSPNCDSNSRGRRFDSPTRLGDSLRRHVETIRVVAFAPAGDTKTISKLRETLRTVWQGRFQQSNCFPFWAEGETWFVEARLEFEDGKRGILITDGAHVALQDHDGMTWYLRLLPAVQ